MSVSTLNPTDNNVPDTTVPAALSREKLIAEWEWRVTQSKYLWESAARSILETLRQYPPNEALTIMRRLEESSRPLAVNGYYASAVSDLEALIESTDAGTPR